MIRIIEIIISIIIGWYFLGFVGIIACCNDFYLYFLNPIRNYNKWRSMNWFGVGVSTLFLNIILLPYAIIYWIYKLFTVGRKNKI